MSLNDAKFPSLPELDPAGDIVALTTALVNFPSVSGSEQELCDAIEQQLAQCEWLQLERINNSLVARTNLGRSSRVIIAGHLDTVPVAGNEQAVLVPAGESMPSGELVTDEVIFGLGSCDMKGGLAVALAAACTIPEPVFDVTYVFYECEEIESSRNGLTLIAASRPDLLQADVAVLLEPSNATIEAGCQGTLTVQIVIPGVRSHSARSWRGDNAIHKLAGLMTTLSNYEPARIAIDGLEYREGLNAVQVHGGVANNVIPDEVRVNVNYRYAPNKSADEALAHVEAVFDGYELTVLDNSAGAMPGLSNPALADLVQRSQGQIAPKFGWTDVARFFAMGIPAVNMGPGDASYAHARNEHVPVSQLLQCQQLVESWLKG